uniref:Uncharacterized protein n=1 Tax=Branchiostoma floridae TaxID=7739 RepID=C3YD35_BRAFL|eukprot:XP_002605636.1 hypothetical protein BRAFLDRAFT_97098 [Branchiostoma floridae]
MNMMIPPDASRATGGRCVKALRWIGCLIALVGIMISVAVVIMTGMQSEEGIRFPGEGLLLLFVGVTLVLLSLCYTSYSPHGTERRRQNSVLNTNIDQPPSYWEVCDLSGPPPDYLEPTSVTSGNGEIVVTITRVKSTPPSAAAVDSAAVNIEEPCRQQDEEEPDEPLPSYEDVALLTDCMKHRRRHFPTHFPSTRAERK